MTRVCLRPVVAAVLGWLALAACCDADPPAAPDSVREALDLPRWRLQVRPYECYDEDLSAGVFRRVGARWDAGALLSGALEHDDQDELTGGLDYQGREETGYSYSSSTDQHILLLGQLRRWAPLGERAAWFIGPQLQGGIGRWIDRGRDTEQDEDDRSERLTRTERNELTLGAGLVLGAEVSLSSRLSLLGALRPLLYTYTWEAWEYETAWTRSNPARAENRHTDRDRVDGSLTTRLDIQAFLTLRL